MGHGKKSDTANLQDELTGELIRLARAVTENERSRSVWVDGGN